MTGWKPPEVATHARQFPTSSTPEVTHM